MNSRDTKAVTLEVSRVPRGTPLGRRTGLLGLGLLLAGLNTGNNLFYLLFSTLAAGEVVGFLLAGRALRRVEARVTAPRRGRVGVPMRITVRLFNKARWLPVPALKWRVGTGSDDETVVITAALPPGAAGTASGRLTPSGRGWLRLDRAEASTAFPLGLSRRVVRMQSLTVETLVTPKLDGVATAGIGSRRGDVRGLMRPQGAGEEPIDAREYEPGDDARRIDWKASARTDRLMWRDRRGEPPRAIQVKLDRSGPPGPAFERRVSRAAAAAMRALARGRAVGLLSDECELLPRSGPAQRRRILDYLALVEPLPTGRSSGQSEHGPSQRPQGPSPQMQGSSPQVHRPSQHR